MALRSALLPTREWLWYAPRPVQSIAPYRPGFDQQLGLPKIVRRIRPIGEVIIDGEALIGDDDHLGWQRRPGRRKHVEYGRRRGAIGTCVTGTSTGDAILGESRLATFGTCVTAVSTVVADTRHVP
jgi:hypothetical protein